jgi:hypothetical protein
MRWLLVVGALAVVAVACSSDDEPETETESGPQRTIDIEDVADTPFCGAYADMLRVVEDIANNIDAENDPDLLIRLQLAYADVASQVPVELQPDAAATLTAMKEFEGPGDLLSMSGEIEDASQRVNAYAGPTCNIDLEANRDALQGFG